MSRTCLKQAKNESCLFGRTTILNELRNGELKCYKFEFRKKIATFARGVRSRRKQHSQFIVRFIVKSTGSCYDYLEWIESKPSSTIEQYSEELVNLNKSAAKNCLVCSIVRSLYWIISWTPFETQWQITDWTLSKQCIQTALGQKRTQKWPC